MHLDGVMRTSSREDFGQQAHRQMRILYVRSMAQELEILPHIHKVEVDEIPLNVMESQSRLQEYLQEQTQFLIHS